MIMIIKQTKQKFKLTPILLKYTSTLCIAYVVNSYQYLFYVLQTSIKTWNAMKVSKKIWNGHSYFPQQTQRISFLSVGGGSKYFLYTLLELYLFEDNFIKERDRERYRGLEDDGCPADDISQYFVPELVGGVLCQ